LLDAEPDLEVVGEEATGHEGLALARHLRPHVTSVTVWSPTHDVLAPVHAIDRLDPENLTGRARAS
jgi:DNA-binding NarL/FixJ family response regulator